MADLLYNRRPCCVFLTNCSSLVGKGQREGGGGGGGGREGLGKLGSVREKEGQKKRGGKRGKA